MAENGSQDIGELKMALEAILFASERPLSAAELLPAFVGDLTAADLQAALEELKQDHERLARGFTMIEIAGGYQIVSHPRFAEPLQRFFASRQSKKVSQASLETLSIVAYRQPVTKSDIEFIRGVNVDRPLKTLLEKGLIKIAGRKDVPGRPILYGTSKEFLAHFGLGSLKDLPPLSEFTEKDLEPGSVPPAPGEPGTTPPAAEAEAAREEGTSGGNDEPGSDT